MMENVNGLSLDLIVHPGETIKEILEDKKMSQEELAKRTGYSAKHISEVISGKKNISNEFANALEYALNISTLFWINLQGNYDRELIEANKVNNITDNEIEVFNELKEIVKYCELENIIEKTNNKYATILCMRKFLGVNNLTAISSLTHFKTAFRGSKKQKVNINVLYAWKKIVEYLTDKIQVDKKFDNQYLKDHLEEIKSTMFLPVDDMIKSLKKIFLNCGIVFEIVRNFVGAPVQGFIEKNNERVILCMTIRQSFSDIFWFTLFHEIGHLINEDFVDQYIDYSFLESEMENKADLFSRNTLINQEDYDLFISKCKLSYENIKEFAKSQNVIPSIVIGRIQNDINDYKFLSKYKVRYKWAKELE